jgi:glycosyltransferase involved in cell wall biosynthesis
MNRPVKLAYVTTLPVSQWGFLQGQNRYLADNGFEIHAIASPGKFLDKLAERDGSTVHAVPISRTISPLQDLVTLARLVVVLRRIRPDLLHVSTPKAALLGAVAGWVARVPIRVFCFRGSITEPASGWRRRLFRRLEWLTARLCTQTICVSKSLRDFARSESIIGPAEGMVAAHGMSNGINAARFSRDAADPLAVPTMPESIRRLAHGPGVVVFGFVGRLAHDKGLDVLQQAWASLRDRFPNAHLLLVGPWEAENSVPPECRLALEHDARVHIAGDITDVVPYYRLMSVFVFPSMGSEGFPNAPMEAAAMGLPVIATRVVGCVEAVKDGVTGMLVPAGNAKALASAMQLYLEKPDLARTHGEAGCDRVRRDFRQETIWKALHQEYLRLLRHASLPADEIDEARVATQPELLRGRLEP